MVQTWDSKPQKLRYGPLHAVTTMMQDVHLHLDLLSSICFHRDLRTHHFWDSYNAMDDQTTHTRFWPWHILRYYHNMIICIDGGVNIHSNQRFWMILIFTSVHWFWSNIIFGGYGWIWLEFLAMKLHYFPWFSLCMRSDGPHQRVFLGGRLCQCLDVHHLQSAYFLKTWFWTVATAGVWWYNYGPSLRDRERESRDQRDQSFKGYCDMNT